MSRKRSIVLAAMTGVAFGFAVFVAGEMTGAGQVRAASEAEVADGSKTDDIAKDTQKAAEHADEAKKVDLGYGLSAVLTEDEIKDSKIRVYQGEHGYGAYLVNEHGKEELIASTSTYIAGKKDECVSTFAVTVSENNEVKTTPIDGTDIVTYHGVGLDELTEAYYNYLNQTELNQGAEDIDWGAVIAAYFSETENSEGSDGGSDINWSDFFQ